MNKHNKIAILIDPSDKHSPSDSLALSKFKTAAKNVGLSASFISKDDFDILNKFDALFVRSVTFEDHYSMGFIKKAKELNIISLDNNKTVFLGSNKHNYLLALTHDDNKVIFNNINIPITCDKLHDKNTFNLIRNHSIEWVFEKLDLKKYKITKSYTGYFCESVKKIEDKEMLSLENDDGFIFQEYMPTEYDWRICILNNKPLFACKYHMVKDHWQIAKHLDNGETIWGDVECIDLKDVPQGVIDLAIDSCRIIGDIGLFGVDIKDYKGNYYLIEVNDNPNIEANFEDKLLGDEIYIKIMKWYADELIKKYA